MADYDPKIIPTLDDIIDDEHDEDIKETIVDLSSLLAENGDGDDDDFDLFAAEVGAEEPDTKANNGDGNPDNAELDLTHENLTTIEVSIEDDSPSIGAIDDIDMNDGNDTDAMHSTALNMAQDANREQDDDAIELGASIPDTAETENFSEEINSDEIMETETSTTGIIEIESVTSESDEFSADKIEISNIEPDRNEADETETGEILPAVTMSEETEVNNTKVNDIEVGEIDLYADEELLTHTIDEELSLTDDNEPLESALIDYHAEQNDDVIIDTHRDTKIDSPTEDSAEPVIEESIEPVTGFDADPIPVHDNAAEMTAANINKMSLEKPTGTLAEDVPDTLPETALITESDALNNSDHDTLTAVTLEDLSENIIQQLMPELEQQLRFLVLKTLHEKLPSEITRQLSPNSVQSDNEDESDL